MLAVTDLTRHIKRLLEGRFTRVWVRGEISEPPPPELRPRLLFPKDAGSQLPVAIFARDVAQQSFRLEDGMEVLLFGDISVFEPHGRYQLIAKVAIRSGEGRLQLEYERLKKHLAAEGLFDSERKKPLPTLPRRIAVITSPTGAALRDFLRILSRRRFRGEVIILPARVQGRGAAQEVINMLAHANATQHLDLVVLTRGGGSIEDLWAFNEEPLARAVAASRLPTISAIGHEIDHVLTDFAADQRAETPSGAAELISSLYLEARQRTSEASATLQQFVADSLQTAKYRFEGLACDLSRQPHPSDRATTDACRRAAKDDSKTRSAHIFTLRKSDYSGSIPTSRSTTPAFDSNSTNKRSPMPQAASSAPPPSTCAIKH